MRWFVYIARAKTGYLYTGISRDVEARIEQHNSGRGAKFARMHKSLKLVYISRAFTTRSAVQKREAQIKSWPKVKKEQLIKDWKK